MGRNIRKIAYFCGALTYGGIAIWLTKNYLSLLIEGLAQWVGFFIYVAEILPFLWLLNRSQNN